MNKADIIDAITDAASISKKEATLAADAFLEQLVKSLQAKEAVNLAGFGSFEAVFRAERNGHNPRTREPMVIPSSYVPKFKAAKKLKEAVNSQEEE